MQAWEQIQQSINYIEDHLSENISMEQLAKQASLSLFYYQRLFSRLVKKSVSEYIRLRRMAIATELLLDQEERILDIAIELGFTSHEHFTRIFKETFKITPKEYRNNPIFLNVMTKPELSMHYILIDEGVPLITEGMILEIQRKSLSKRIQFIGLNKEMPVSFIEGLGTESGTNDLDSLWRQFHDLKTSEFQIPEQEEEIGVTYPSNHENTFLYFVGAKSNLQSSSAITWQLQKGNYIVCTFEAENFTALVTDALYKAQQYLYQVWLPSHNLFTQSFCVERYVKHDLETSTMEVWLQLCD